MDRANQYTLLTFTVFLLNLQVFCQPNYFGEFRAEKVMNYDGSNLSSTSLNPIAFIYSSPTSSLTPYFALENGIIQFNDQPLTYNSLVRAYLDLNQRTPDDTIKWILLNQQNIVQFTYSPSVSYPNYANSITVPNSISKGNELKIEFGNFENIDEIEFNIDDQRPHAVTPWYRIIPGGIKKIVIPAVHLTSINSNVVALKISLIKREYKEFDGKNYKFEARLTINKNVTVTE
jgi:hypothetical protein